MKNLFYVFILLGLISCYDYSEDPPYYYLSNDDMSYLIWPEDSLVFEGRTEYDDTLLYLSNKTDTIKIRAATWIDSYLNPWSWNYTKEMSGNTQLILPNSTGFDNTTIYISKNRDSTIYRYFSVSVSYKLTSISREFYPWENPDLDTAVVLGKTYDQVYKMDIDYTGKDSVKGMKTAYFAKHFGYIKLENLKGSILELLPDQD